MKSISCIILPLILLSSCAPTRVARAYEGTALPRDQIAVLKAADGRGLLNMVPVCIAQVDSTKVKQLIGDWACPGEVQVLPGHHTVTLEFYQANTIALGPPPKVAFTAKKGGTYKVEYNQVGSSVYFSIAEIPNS